MQAIENYPQKKDQVLAKSMLKSIGESKVDA